MQPRYNPCRPGVTPAPWIFMPCSPQCPQVICFTSTPDLALSLTARLLSQLSATAQKKRDKIWRDASTGHSAEFRALLTPKPKGFHTVTTLLRIKQY